MHRKCKLLVFSDLDGTLIDHVSYDWRPAQDALSALKGIDAGLILASSKTAAEMAVIRSDIGADVWPAIVENGAGVLPAKTSEVSADASDFERLRSALATLPRALRAGFLGFGDSSVSEVSEMTGLDLAAAKLAKQRAFSEPGQWLGSEAEKSEFLAMLAEQGISAQQGGRFLTLSFGGNKVDQMRRMIAQFSPEHTIALGDAPNDIAMLEEADFGVVIANPHRPPLAPLKGEGTDSITRTSQAGPEGWNTAILHLIHHLDLR